MLRDACYDFIVISAKNSPPILKQAAELGIQPNVLVDWWNEKSLPDFINVDKRKLVLLEESLSFYRRWVENAPYEYGNLPKPIIKGADKLLERILQDGLSLCRYGDGEFEMMLETERPWFQTVNKTLAKRLKEIVNCSDSNIIIALADDFGNLDKYTDVSANAIRQYMLNSRNKIMPMLVPEKIYYDAYVSRVYMMYKDKAYAKKMFGLWKRIWQGRNILMVEGLYSRYGWNNDLFAGAASVRRILCPEKNAFDRYAEIFSAVISHAQKNDLVLVSLGPTATVLAYDVAMTGIQTIDIGQLDNEYDWFLMGVEKQTAVPGKCVAELTGAHVPEESEDEKFNSQVIARIG